MPRPEGRDRLEGEIGENGSVVLLSRVGKPWTPREEGSGATRPGTAVRWEDELYEVLLAEARPSGGWRYVLGPWDARIIVRSVVEYGEAASEPGAEAAEAAEARKPGPPPSRRRPSRPR